MNIIIIIIITDGKGLRQELTSPGPNVNLGYWGREAEMLYGKRKFSVSS